MASPASDAGRHLHLQHHYTESVSEPAVREAQKWIEAVTGRSFGEKDFRGALDNGILLCELLSSVKPGLVKKINRLQTPIAGLDNLTLFLRGCEELGLKGSQLFDPGDLQDTASRTHNKASDCSRKLKNVLITIYWLGRAANSIATYNGPTLDLHEFEGLLSQMRKEGEEWDSPKRSIRDSGYIDCWESERSDSLSPPRHARDDSFDSLDSIGSRSRHTPSPDGLLARGSSDGERGRGSDSECDIPHRKLPDVRRDDMLARRTSCSEPRSAVPFNQYLPNKSNQTAYVPALLRRQHTDREDGRKSWSSATSPTGGERPFRFSHRSSISDDTESMSMIDMRNEDDVLLPAHSQVRHELMHSQYSRMKEDESHWQDDLARWKSRRRSVSQDLIKKEETRKMMEKLMNRDECPQRRRSIKTYREIVEDKERRERELHEAYLKAKTPEEAAAVLHRYAQRFTISEAILERLKLPRLLERSVSADPTRGPTSTCPSSPDDSVFSPTGPGPLRYLRQQSLPAPKFTASVEALVRTCGSQQGDTAGGGAGGAAGASLLGPRPYGHSRAASCRETVAQQEMERVNGEAERDRWAENDREKDGERKREEDTPPPLFYPSPSRSAESDSDSVPSSDRRPSGTLTPAHTPTHSSEPERLDRADSEAMGQRNSEAVGQRNSEAVGQRIPGSEPQSREGEWTPSRPTFLLMQVPIEEEAVLQAGGVSLPLKEEEPRKEKLPESEWVPVEQSGRGPDSVLSQNGTTRTTPDTQAPLRNDITAKPIGKPVLESPQKTSERPESASRIQSEPKPVCGIPAAEPAEKPHGNERYNREQEKLKQEWEKAQKEVEEEERKYHEEEKKILEETVAPLTPHSPMPPSPCWLDAAHPTGITTPHGIVRSLADWERKQQELENQMETLENKTQREYEKKETAGPSQMTGRLQQRTCDQLAGQHSGQRAEAAEQSKGVQQEQPGQDVSWSTKQHQQKQSSSKDLQNTAVVDSTRNTQPSAGGRRRSDSIEHVGVSQSVSYTDTQQPPSPNRSVSGKKLCSSCGNPLGKGAAMIIETLSLYFHIQCFKCGICKGQLGDTATGTDVRIRNGLLNCHQCYIRSRTAGQPTTL